MDNYFTAAGLACLIGAIVGGGLKAFGVEVPLLQSLVRQVILGVLGVVLLAFGLGAFNHPSKTNPPRVLVKGWSSAATIGVGQATSVHINALDMANGTCPTGAMGSLSDSTGGRFLPSQTTTVSDLLDEHCEFTSDWLAVAGAANSGSDVYHDLQGEVTKDGVSLGKVQITVHVRP
jgi:hypothetical protein